MGNRTGNGVPQQVLDCLSDAIYALDDDFRFTFANASALALWGKTAEDVLGRRLTDAFPETLGSEALDAHFRAAAARRFLEIETRSPVLDRWIRVGIHPSASGLVVHFRDVTEHRRASEALLESEARYRALFEQAAVGVKRVDLECRLIDANDALCRLLGRRREDLIGHTIESLTWPDDVGAEGPLIASLLRGDIPSYVIEKRCRGPGDTPVWVRIAQSVARIDGAPAYMISVVEDITGRKRAEQALRELNATLELRVEERTRELEHIFRLSLDMLGICGFDGRFRRISPAWEGITGRTVDEILSRPFMDFVHPDDRAKTAAEFRRLVDGLPTLEFENRYQHADGSWRLISWRAVPAPDERLIYAAARDITAERAAYDRMRQSQKLEALGQLTGGIAHDFNNLLTAVLGNLELARQDAAADSPLAAMLDSAARAAQRGADLVTQLLAFARGQQQATEPVAANDVILRLSDLLDRAVGPAITLRHALDPSAGVVSVNAAQFESALLNIVINARDAMPTGGTLTIVTRPIAIGPAHPELAPGAYVEIALIDTGTGISPEIAERLFEPFFTTKEGKGTGLGLSQVYGFAQQSGGSARIENARDGGTRVSLFLPRTGAPPPKPEPAHTRVRPAARGGFVVVVDDDPDVLPMVVGSLRSLGYKTAAASNGPAALALIDARAPDAVIVDYAMPDMNGVEFIRALRARRPGTPVILTSGQANIEHAEGAAALLRKPFHLNDLVAALTVAMAGSPPAAD